AAIAKAENQTGDSDPIQAAIARAQARKAARAANPVNDHQVQQEKLARIEARLAKAREKLAADDGSDPTIATALQNAVRTTERKLTDLQAELAGTAVKPDNETENA
ncbi:MAG: alkylation response protein AidB-like acyl-CoA dehydrogenase, partial [Congregibacter sp.]